MSDEFTVPLCRGHHREVHRCGDEATLRQFAPQCVMRIATIETFQRAPSAETHAWGSIKYGREGGVGLSWGELVSLACGGC